MDFPTHVLAVVRKTGQRHLRVRHINRKCTWPIEDIDAVVPGTIDDSTGAIAFAETESAASYGIVDEIAGRAIASGARVLGARKADMPGNAELAAILRFPV